MTFIFEVKYCSVKNHIVHQEGWLFLVFPNFVKNSLFLEEQLSERLPKRLAPYFKGIS